MTPLLPAPGPELWMDPSCPTKLVGNGILSQDSATFPPGKPQERSRECQLMEEIQSSSLNQLRFYPKLDLALKPGSGNSVHSFQLTMLLQ